MSIDKVVVAERTSNKNRSSSARGDTSKRVSRRIRSTGDTAPGFCSCRARRSDELKRPKSTEETFIGRY